MTPLHLAVDSNRIEMVECLLDHEADINLQDDNEVILHTNAVDYFELAGKCCTHCSVSLLFEHKMLSLQAPKLGSDLYHKVPSKAPTPLFSVVWVSSLCNRPTCNLWCCIILCVRACKSSANWSLFQDCVGLRRPRQVI